MASIRTFLAAAAAAVLVAGLAPPAEAGRIERACAASARAGGDARLCGCIQRIADQLLTRSDQRLAASFFDDPHRAQEVRQSDRSRDEAFWQRYRQFGDVAEASCR